MKPMTRGTLRTRCHDSSFIIICPSALAKRITDSLSIPTIGIGAGNVTDGQILVMHDLVGISAGYIPKFSKNFLLETGNMPAAVKKYCNDVKSGVFPSAEHEFK